MSALASGVVWWVLVVVRQTAFLALLGLYG